MKKAYKFTCDNIPSEAKAILSEYENAEKLIIADWKELIILSASLDANIPRSTPWKLEAVN